MNDHPDRRISRRDFFRAAGTAAAALAALGLGGYALQRWDTAGAVDGASGSGSDRRHPVYQETFQAEGRTWRRKTNLESYLFLGIDTLGRAEGTQSYVAGGQADAQILLVVDHTARTWQMLQINRDSMVQVPVLSMMGTVPYTIRQQIALAHAYGNGREQSCENNVRAVSMLLGDQPIDGYLSMTMGGVGVLVDLLGGVTLTLGSDLSAVDPALTQGATVTLNGEQALAYVHSRQNVDDQTNLARMERQRQFLRAFEEQARQMDPSFALEAYEAAEDYIITNIPGGRAVNLAGQLQQYTQLPVLTIDGENRVEDGYWAYELDQDSLQQTVLQLFYQEI